MQVNTTGKTETKDLTIPKGQLFFAELSSTDVPGGYLFAGNAPEMQITMDVETYEHFTSQEGIKNKDLELLISRDLNISFKLEEFNTDNISKFFSGETVTVTNPAVAGFTVTNLVPAGTIQTGMYYDIKDSSGVRAMDLVSANVTIKTTNTTPVTLVEGTDYDLDLELGRVFLVPGSTKLATAISAAEGLTVVVAATAGARAILETSAFTKEQTIVAVKWVSLNANSRERAASPKVEYYFPKVTLTSDQSLNLVGAETVSMGFKGSCVKSKVTPQPLVMRTVTRA